MTCGNKENSCSSAKPANKAPAPAKPDAKPAAKAPAATDAKGKAAAPAEKSKKP